MHVQVAVNNYTMHEKFGSLKVQIQLLHKGVNVFSNVHIYSN